jgi:hypothetical protein
MAKIRKESFVCHFRIPVSSCKRAAVASLKFWGAINVPFRYAGGSNFDHHPCWPWLMYALDPEIRSDAVGFSLLCPKIKENVARDFSLVSDSDSKHFCDRMGRQEFFLQRGFPQRLAARNPTQQGPTWRDLRRLATEPEAAAVQL